MKIITLHANEDFNDKNSNNVVINEWNVYGCHKSKGHKITRKDIGL